MTEIDKQTLDAIRDSLVDAKSHIDKALETFDAKLYLASYANLNMGVAAGKVAQELCAIERNRHSGGIERDWESESGGRCAVDIPTCGTDSGSEGQRPPTGKRAERRATPRTGK